MELNTIAENSETKNSDGEKNEVRSSTLSLKTLRRRSQELITIAGALRRRSQELNTITENSETKNSDGEKNEVRFSISLPRASELGNLTKKEEEEGGCSVQLLCGLAISLVALLQGASISSSAIFVVLVNEHPEDLKDQPNDLFDFGLNLAGKDFPLWEHWVASIWILSHLIFAPVAGFVNDKIGRRRALMIDNVFPWQRLRTFHPSVS